jgi:hypothetical protein
VALDCCGEVRGAMMAMHGSGSRRAEQGHGVATALGLGGARGEGCAAVRRTAEQRGTGGVGLRKRSAAVERRRGAEERARCGGARGESARSS